MKKPVFANKVLSFYKSLQPDFRLPKGFRVMNPYSNAETMAVTELFYRNYFNDTVKRRLIFGINPGRFGGGITGIPFTDPVQLLNECGINHSFPPKAELSSQFIYKMIQACGGAKKFYSKFFLTAVCPLGFLNGHLNANYYDSPQLMRSTRSFIIQTIREQVKLGCYTDYCFCLGFGKNMDYLEKLNMELKLFKKIIPLPHPRWIMQYRRKFIDQFIVQYLEAFSMIATHR